jgi:hypothetical protein
MHNFDSDKNNFTKNIKKTVFTPKHRNIVFYAIKEPTYAAISLSGAYNKLLYSFVESP